MNLRDRLLERLGVPTEPETVDRAPRRERWKRNAWMTISVVVAAIAAGGVLLAVDHATGLLTALSDSPGAAQLFPLATFIALWMAIDWVLWRWGFERFGLVPPWQFREDWDEVSEP